MKARTLAVLSGPFIACSPAPAAFDGIATVVQYGYNVSAAPRTLRCRICLECHGDAPAGACEVAFARARRPVLRLGSRGTDEAGGPR